MHRKVIIATLLAAMPAVAIAQGSGPPIKALEARVAELELRVDELEFGEAWALPDALPSGSTLRGIWGTHSRFGQSLGALFAPFTRVEEIGFAIPLAVAPTFHPLSHWIVPGLETLECPGWDAVTLLPAAAPGHLCVYQTNADDVSLVDNKTAQWSKRGVTLIISSNVNFPAARGTWAVTAP
jgi:hypothetical protein